MMPSLLLIPMLSLALAAPVPPDDKPYAKVELRGQFRIENDLSEKAVFIIWIDDAAYELDLTKQPDLLNKELLEQLDGEKVLVKGALHLTGRGRSIRGAPLVVVSALTPVKK